MLFGITHRTIICKPIHFELELELVFATPLLGVDYLLIPISNMYNRLVLNIYLKHHYRILCCIYTSMEDR